MCIINTMEKRQITLPNGNILQLDASREFLEIVRQHFNLDDTSQVDNEHLRIFVLTTTSAAIDKAESNL